MCQQQTLFLQRIGGNDDLYLFWWGLLETSFHLNQRYKYYGLGGDVGPYVWDSFQGNEIWDALFLHREERLSSFNLTPSKLQPNLMAFVRAFKIVCFHLDMLPTLWDPFPIIASIGTKSILFLRITWRPVR